MDNDKAKFKNEFNKRLIKFSLEAIRLCSDLRKDRNLCAIADQLIRSGTSVGANIIEAKAASSTKDYVRFFEIALKSSYETSYWLILVRESKPIYSEKANILLAEVSEITKIISSSILTLKGKKHY